MPDGRVGHGELEVDGARWMMSDEHPEIHVEAPARDRGAGRDAAPHPSTTWTQWPTGWSPAEPALDRGPEDSGVGRVAVFRAPVRPPLVPAPVTDGIGDLLGARFRAETIPLPPDDEGEVVATLVRREPSERSRSSGRAVLYLHGYNDYFFHRALADAWDAAGYAFFALDLRKAGRSLRAHQTPSFVRRLSEYAPELDEALRRVRSAGARDVAGVRALDRRAGRCAVAAPPARRPDGAGARAQQPVPRPAGVVVGAAGGDGRGAGGQAAAVRRAAEGGARPVRPQPAPRARRGVGLRPRPQGARRPPDPARVAGCGSAGQGSVRRGLDLDIPVLVRAPPAAYGRGSGRRTCARPTPCWTPTASRPWLPGWAARSPSSGSRAACTTWRCPPGGSASRCTPRPSAGWTPGCRRRVRNRHPTALVERGGRVDPSPPTSWRSRWLCRRCVALPCCRPCGGVVAEPATPRRPGTARPAAGDSAPAPRSAVTGAYPGLGRGRLALMAAALVYIVSPIDLVPESFLLVLGLADDVAVAAWLTAALLVETDRFLTWEVVTTTGGGAPTGGVRNRGGSGESRPTSCPARSWATALRERGAPRSRYAWRVAATASIVSASSGALSGR